MTDGTFISRTPMGSPFPQHEMFGIKMSQLLCFGHATLPRSADAGVLRRRQFRQGVIQRYRDKGRVLHQPSILLVICLWKTCAACSLAVHSRMHLDSHLTFGNLLIFEQGFNRTPRAVTHWYLDRLRRMASTALGPPVFTPTRMKPCVRSLQRWPSPLQLLAFSLTSGLLTDIIQRG